MMDILQQVTIHQQKKWILHCLPMKEIDQQMPLAEQYDSQSSSVRLMTMVKHLYWISEKMLDDMGEESCKHMEE